MNIENVCRVYTVESVSKIKIVLMVTAMQYMGLHVSNCPIRV